MKKTILILIFIIPSMIKVYSQSSENTNIDIQNYKKGERELQARNFTTAISYFNKVINSTPLTSTTLITAECYLYRGVAKGELKDNRGAIKDFTKVINTTRISSIKGQGYYMRGFSYLQMNDFDSACYDFSNAGELGVNQAYEMIGKYCN